MLTKYFFLVFCWSWTVLFYLTFYLHVVFFIYLFRCLMVEAFTNLYSVTTA